VWMHKQILVVRLMMIRFFNSVSWFISDINLSFDSILVCSIYGIQPSLLSKEKEEKNPWFFYWGCNIHTSKHKVVCTNFKCQEMKIQKLKAMSWNRQIQLNMIKDVLSTIPEVKYNSLQYHSCNEWLNWEFAFGNN
jgi:hypothetical protein